MWVSIVICCVIMCHCCLSSMFAVEIYKSGTIPLIGSSFDCIYNCSPWGLLSYCCFMMLTICLLVYLLSYEWEFSQ